MNSTRAYPRPHVDAANTNAIGHAGGVLLTDVVRATGLGRVLSETLAPWRKPMSRHDPGKVILDAAISVALGGDALSDIAALRAEPAVYGAVASDPTISRTITALAADVTRVETAVATARRSAREAAWSLAGEHAPDTGRSPRDPLIIDLDATLITAHSEKEDARPTFKRGFGFHPLTVSIDHGADATGEMVAMKLRPGNAGSNTVTDHIDLARRALRQVPGIDSSRPGKSVLIRADGAGGTKGFLGWLTARRVSYSVGFTLPFETPEAYRLIPEAEWQAAIDADGEPRDGAGVVEITGLLDLTGWPDGMRVIVRRERPHPGAQLRFDDIDGYRLTAFATNQTRGQLAHLELRHRRRARAEDRIRDAKDTGLRNLPLKTFAQNRIWCLIVGIASELIAWLGLLAHPDEPARRWEPKRLRHRLFTLPAAIARTGRRVWLRFANRSRWASVLTAAIARLRALPAPAG